MSKTWRFDPWTIVKRFHFHLLTAVALFGGVTTLALPVVAGMFPAEHLGDMSEWRIEAYLRRALATEDQLHVKTVGEFDGESFNGASECTIVDKAVLRKLAVSLRITTIKEPFGACACRRCVFVSFEKRPELRLVMKHDFLIVTDSSGKSYSVTLAPAFMEQFTAALKTRR